MHKYILLAGLWALMAVPALAATLPLDPNSPCPITHDCRKSDVLQPDAPQPSAKRLPCPQGTIAIPNSNRCKVIAVGP